MTNEEIKAKVEGLKEALQKIHTATAQCRRVLQNNDVWGEWGEGAFNGNSASQGRFTATRDPEIPGINVTWDEGEGDLPAVVALAIEAILTMDAERDALYEEWEALS